MNPLGSVSSRSASTVPAANDGEQGSPSPLKSGPAVVSLQPSSPFHAEPAGGRPVYATANTVAYAAAAKKPEPAHQAPLLVPFSTPQDTQAFQARLSALAQLEVPDARKAARDFIRQNLGVDGDQYIVAHFKDDDSKTQGKPDKAFTLTEAVMQNFPGFRHRGAAPYLSDEIGFYSTGGVPVTKELKSLLHSQSAGEFFGYLGRSLINRTGPGYIYNLFAHDNPAAESLKTVDQSFGIYKKTAGGAQSYAKDSCSDLLPSEVYRRFKAGAFHQVPYITALNAELDTYWNTVKGDWPSARRYQFLEDARGAAQRGSLTKDEYKMVMKAAVPQLPLKPPYTLKDLDRASPPDPSVKVARFDIYGYRATDIVRFIGSDHREVMYIPGNEPPFVVFHNNKERNDWVVAQGKDPSKSAQLLRHFSVYDRQDGTLFSGVESALKGLAHGTWSPGDGYVDQDNRLIEGDVFQDMAGQVEHRLREDSGMQTRTAGEAWLDTLNMWSVLMIVGPGKSLSAALQVGKAMQLGTQIATGVVSSVNGKTPDEREGGVLQTGVAAGTAPV
ncbi:MAG TPA: DUF6543 domain-containing protein [Dyella sp.]|uniref:dermonecrotic toxin domain-containing protein n=1 Tax=Dyella sp. TaxID=1869338 RepID=UPI002CCCEBF1|nr:DUF6543 domain-containing protein [Dyella sp.]HTV86102.1 DUF6543 domain-containing protein [Dyella sp.]